MPQAGLIEKIKSMGIGGKLLNFIKSLYKNPHMTVRVGCLLSTMLFGMHINDIFDGVDGFYVPGLGKWIPFSAPENTNSNNTEILIVSTDSKKSLLQLWKRKKPNVLPSMGLETAKFMDGIPVARTLILDGIKCSPTPLNRFPEGMESL
ncbi:hypothetical protein BB561_005339, partial [Smittium simulii]